MGRSEVPGVGALLAALLLATPALAQEHQHGDRAYHEMQERGRAVMGVDQYSSAHAFEAFPDGGRIVLQRMEEDSAGAAAIRDHLARVAQAFSRGDFALPGCVHGTGEVPGTRVMADLRERIRYEFRELPRGGEVRIVTTDPAALHAVHEFLAFQRREHRTE